MQICTLEEMSITAWPSFQQILMDGWILRFADGYTFRSNSVQPIYPGDDNVEGKIRRCEELYTSASLKPAFKISPCAQPSQLDATLNSKGYQIYHRTSVQVHSNIPEYCRYDDAADIQNVPLHEWLDAFTSISAASSKDAQYHAAIIEKIPVPMCTMVAHLDGKPVSCARGVIHGDYVGIYDVCTIQDARRMGLATHVIYRVLSWASGCGAKYAYLQVVEDNAAAIRLYHKLGFKHIYSYWYRVHAI
ncbi:MAG: GNAT family N-acetyltransferase [Armatimonadota bacterium]